MPKYHIRFSGYITNVDAISKDKAIESVKEYAHLYAWFNADEIGVDVDENGYKIVTNVVDNDEKL